MCTKEYDIPWNKYALISDMAKRLNKTSSLIGKTVLQDMMYILKDIFKVPCQYRYSLYSYGPYSDDLTNDLDYVDFLKGVTVSWENSKGEYHISPGVKCDHIRQKAQNFLDDYETETSKAVDEFGNKTANELEMIATIVYIDRYSKNNEETLSLDQIIERAEGMKPKYIHTDIKNIAKSLSGKHYIL